MASKGRLLIVDDENIVRDSLSKWFREEGYEVGTAESASDALTRLAERRWDLALVDIKMPGTDGIELQRRLREVDPDLTVVIMTGYASVETAVQALKNGAYDYVTKPFDPDDIAHLVANALAHKRAQQENVRLRETIAEVAAPQEMIGQSAAMKRVFEAIETVGPTEATVLITGESGTGKELVARAVHAASPRRFNPLVVIHCGALPDTLLESELFGHVRGAFTDARRDKPGRFVLAHRGTLFLDEVGDLSPAFQVKLLRVLEDGEVHPLGATAGRRVDVRVVAATHRDLAARVREGLFREDLYYRLRVVELRLPPLAERPGDVPLLAQHFVRRAARRTGKAIEGLSPAALRLLQAYDFPGNVRELRNIVERAFVFCRGPLIEPQHLPPEVRAGPSPAGRAGAGPRGTTVGRDDGPATGGPHGAVLDATRLRAALDQHRWNRTATARALGVGRNTLWRWMRRTGLLRRPD